jgi:hypothetical protein
MEKTTAKDPTALLLVLAAALAAAAIWAATALAGGDNGPASEPASAGDALPTYIQAQDDGDAPAQDDCPEDESGSGGGDSGASDAGSTSL